MTKEKIGIISEIIDKNNGIIIDDDGIEYLLSSSDLLANFELKIGLKVIFKPYISIVNNYEIKQAVLVELFN